MRILVYGTLKKDYWNNGFLQGCEFIQDHVVQGFKLFNVGFPVAIPSENDKIKGEIWEIGDVETDEKAQKVLASLDRLEGVPHMYRRAIVDTVDDHPIHMYIGSDRFNGREMRECDAKEGIYEWNA